MQKITFVKDDTAPTVVFELLKGEDGTIPIDLSSPNTTVELIMAGSGTVPPRVLPMEVGDLPLLGECIYRPIVGGTETVGDFAAYIRVTFGDGTVQTILNQILVRVVPVV